MLKLYVLGLLSFFLLAGCETDIPHQQPAVKQEPRTKSMSRNTELKAASSEIIIIKVPTVICKMCENNIKTAFDVHDGIIDINVNLKKKTAKVEYDPVITNPDKIRQVISNAGYDADTVKRNINAYQKLDECCKLESNIHS